MKMFEVTYGMVPWFFYHLRWQNLGVFWRNGQVIYQIGLLWYDQKKCPIDIRQYSGFGGYTMNNLGKRLCDQLHRPCKRDKKC